MEAEMVPSLSPLLQGADEWGEVLLLLPLLVALEAVLSADNAIALAAISRRLHDPSRQRQALNLGLLMALVLRMALIVAARWVLDAWPLQLAAAAYLLWLCGRHLLGLDENADEPSDQAALDLLSSAEIATAASAAAGASDDSSGQSRPAPSPHHPTAASADRGAQHGHRGPSLASIALTLAFTDLAFSLDSVAAAVAVTDRLALVMAGGLLGVLALRLTAGLFVRWLEVFSRLETAGYLAVGLVGVRLLLRLLLPDLDVPEWILLLLVAALFLWGFSQRCSAVEPPAEPADGALAVTPSGVAPAAPTAASDAAPAIPVASAAPLQPAPADRPQP